jgi:PAS domain S-box-containing protein
MTTTQLEHNSARLLDSVTSHSRFPISNAGASLLAVIHSATEGVIVIDATRQIVLVNHKAEKMFGYSARQLLDKSVDLLLLPRIGSERRRMERLAAIRVSGRRTRLGLRGLHSNGDVFPISASISPITVRGEMFLMATLRDLRGQVSTERRRFVKTAELRRLAMSSQQAHEVEKRRFSRELYDDIGQRLSVLKLDLDWLENSLPDTNDNMPARVAQMQGMLDKVITLTKSMASALRPPLLDDFGLMPAVEWMTDHFQKKNGVRCTIEGIGMKHVKLDDPIESAVFRVIQEGLLNIEKHARARNAKVVLHYTGMQLEISIEDDGIGLGPECDSKPGCYGLVAMQERIFILGGTISIKNTKPQGVAIHASIPIDSLPIQ